MKFRNIKKYAIALMSVAFVAGCTSDFEEMNQNPNGPVVIPSYLHLPSIMEATADQLYSTFNGGDMGATWVQHWAKVQYNDEERYSPRVTSINSWWNLLYARPLQDSRKMKEFARNEGNQQIVGVALIWETYIFSLLTDTFGDIPFTEALKGEQGVTLPTYDRQQDIYPALVDSLESAVAYLGGTGTIPAANDVMYGGDASKWIKFANSLRFRLLMRMSAKVDVNADLQALVNEGNMFSSNEDNAQLNYLGQNPNANPLWNTIVFTNRLEWRINETLVTVMQGLNDPRLEVYAQPNDADIIRGAAPGIEEPTTKGYDFANTSMLGEYFLRPNTPAVFMDYAELNFLLAEAANKNMISGGDAAEAAYYNAGVTASFDTYNGVEVESGEIFISASSYLATPAVAYDPSEGLVLINTQKWIALYGQGIEAWTEWRRTQLPALDPAIDPIGINEIPSRYYYPSDEQSLNSTNYAAAVAAMGAPDVLTTPVWWME
ncbi:MAG TPA: SusD/RagB family nutrient-binding outer membrane lipoprotein [Chryseosolibacter sp.]|nr:SusD/RagB family nutrient-binding outer membrane lipoprotein [Chryseosolibacter sp.]